MTRQDLELWTVAAELEQRGQAPKQFKRKYWQGCGLVDLWGGERRSGVIEYSSLWLE